MPVTSTTTMCIETGENNDKCQENLDSKEDFVSNELEDLFHGLLITAETTLSQARKIKINEKYEGCALCLKKFNTYKEVRKHITKKHHAIAKEVRKDLDEAVAAYEEYPESGICAHNLKLAKKRKHFLVRFTSAR